MALGPKDLELTSEETLEVNQIEAEIDRALMLSFGLNNKQYEVHVGQITSQRVTTELIRRYRATGWSNVTRHHGTLIFSK
ncbi:MAG: hypothetical protein WC857_01050 [Candidatus Paceibacterota bacterium]|jgi:hypothetical protein